MGGISPTDLRPPILHQHSGWALPGGSKGHPRAQSFSKDPNGTYEPSLRVRQWQTSACC